MRHCIVLHGRVAYINLLMTIVLCTCAPERSAVESPILIRAMYCLQTLSYRAQQWGLHEDLFDLDLHIRSGV